MDAFKAGSDVLIIPADLDASVNAMVSAVRSGEISSERLDASVFKILKAKASLGLHKSRLVDIDKLADLIGTPENLALGQQTSDEALTLIRDNGKVLPLKHSGTVSPGLPYQNVEDVRNRLLVVVFSEDVRTESGRVLEQEFRRRVPDVNVMYVDAHIATPLSVDVLKTVESAQAVIAAVYVVPTAGKAVKTEQGLKNSVSLSSSSGMLLQSIIDRAGERTEVVAMGNPYLAQDFPAVQNYLCAFSNATVSEVSAVKALFGEIPIRGHLPVTIPGVAQRGAGIERPAQAAPGGLTHE